MSILQEFKTFAMRGNVIDLAVGLVIGAAFGKIVASLVANLLMPLLGLVMGSVDLSTLAITLRTASADKPALVMGYGVFLQAVFDFLLVAFAIFMLVKGVNRMKRKEEAKPAAEAEVPADERLLTEIRDLLRAKARV